MLQSVPLSIKLNEIRAYLILVLLHHVPYIQHEMRYKTRILFLEHCLQVNDSWYNIQNQILLHTLSYM